MKNSYDIIVIGGGAAGIISAWRSASLEANVLLLEKNSKLGMKIRISGGGKCNITHSGDMETLRNQFQKNEARFLKYAFHTFTNSDILSLLSLHGIETYAKENGKIFPKSNNADDVVAALKKMLIAAGVEIHPHSAVKRITKSGDKLFSVETENEIFISNSVIIAVGGSSYKKTGTTGDGFAWAKQFGHTILPIRPALAPIYLAPAPPFEWQGVPIRDCVVKAKLNGKIFAEKYGDILFTHVGISGPAVLEISRDTFVEFEKGNQIQIGIDFFPEVSFEQLEQKILVETKQHSTRQILTTTERLIPQRLAQFLLLQTKIDATKKLHQLEKDERKNFVQALKECEIGIVKEIPLDRGEVTAGGVALNEIDPTTMQSKLMSGLFFCGEILDIAGPIGGYNLQAAFSTGFVAGESAAKK